MKTDLTDSCMREEPLLSKKMNRSDPLFTHIHTHNHINSVTSTTTTTKSNAINKRQTEYRSKEANQSRKKYVCGTQIEGNYMLAYTCTTIFYDII